MNKPIAAMTVALSLAAAQGANGATARAQYSYFEGQRYAFIISDEMYAAMRAWNPGSGDFPPLPPGRALEIAQKRLRQIPIPGNCGWRLEAVALEPVNDASPDGKWIYVVRFQYFMNGPSTGVWPTMDFIVTMDGKLVEPVISTARPNQ